MRSINDFLKTLLLILIPINVFALTDSLMIRVIELERSIMQTSSDSIRTAKLFEKSSLYKLHGKYAEALSALNRINDQKLDSAAREYYHYQKAFNLFMTGSYYSSLQEMWSLSKIRSAEARLLYLLVLLENERWEDFKKQFIIEAMSEQRDAASFVEAFKIPITKYPPRYSKLSIVPGLGLIKAGYPGKGITSILLQAAFAGFGVYQITSGYYFTGLFSGLLPARRFHVGGKVLAGSMAERSNDEDAEHLKKIGRSHVNVLFSSY